jgi:HAD superfamily hydrolase (TIGR01490 family)
MDLALFDFDGTITTKGAYPDFVSLAIRRPRKIVGGLLLSPALVGYQVKLVSDKAIRSAISRVGFWREEPDRVRRIGREYAERVLPGLIRPIARERIAWHKGRGDRVVVVSASLDVYLEPWCQAQGVEVICTELEAAHGRFTGRYLNGDCCGDEKARRIRQRYALADYETIYAYGDTEEDRQMLELAHRKFFRWAEVRDVPVRQITSLSTP